MTAPRVITSLANPLVKAARALHTKKARDESGTFLAEGLKIATDALDLGRTPKSLIYGREMREHPRLRSLEQATLAAGGEAVEVGADILQKISRRDNPQAVLAIYEQTYAALNELAPQRAGTWVALEAVRDPGNLGTIVRTADAAGCGGVILVGECCDPYSVEGVRATMGSIFAVPLFRAAPDAFLDWRRAWTGSVVGALLSASLDHRIAEYHRPTLILLGNEQQGLSEGMARSCDVAVKIPMRGRADSLNLAVAAGVMIYAALD
jgi:TrmH family RNA methyltransferase